MAQPSTRDAPRFHRRILGIGALLTLVLLVIGAPFFINRIEADLEDRVPSELAEAGFVGVAATFSGQDGTLRCAAPLDDPEEAIAAAYAVWGVRAIELDRSCRVNRAPTVETTTTLPAVDDTGTGSETDPGGTLDDGGAVTDPDDGEAPETTIPPDFDTVADIVAATPQLSLLAVLIDEAGLSEFVGDPAGDPITLFAPTDDAFDALDADELAAVRADPELLGQVLSHHAVAGATMLDDLVEGPVTALDGGTLEVEFTDSGVSVSGAAITTADITATNGTVHVIDQVLIPDDIDFSGARFAESSAVFEDGQVTLTGVVASEVERAVLGAAVASAPEPPTVDDRLTVDPVTGLDAATTESLATLVAVMPLHLLTGVSGFDGAELYVTGTYVNDEGRDAMLAAAEAVSAMTELEPPPQATETDAVDLEAELNAFVADNPILFEPSSSLLTEPSLGVLDQLALAAQQVTGVAITVEGHTDSDGDPRENVVLSQYRALVVRQGLIDRGVPEGSITAVGFGSEQPVLVDGAEDKLASRRVEFRVVTTP